MRTFKLIPVALLAGVIVGALPFVEPVHLIRIEKGEARLLDVLTREQVDVVQELRTCYLAMADRDEIAALRGAGASVAVVERNAGGASLALLAPVPAEARASLARAGRLTSVETGVLLFRASAGDAAALIPPGLAWKPLPSATVLPYIRPASRPAAAAAGAAPRNDIVSRLVDEVSAANLRTHVQTLQDFVTRYTATPGCEAAGSYIYSYFTGLGLDVRFQDVTSSAGVSRNVVAELPGRVYPDDVLIVCGHYDSYSDRRPAVAPGADDNASGTAAVMEAARVLAGEPLDFTVRFVAFTAEELGLVGSRLYAGGVRSRGERIVGVINLDMIAFADRMPEDLEVIANTSSAWLSAKFASVAADYGLIPTKQTIDASIVFSDHAPFWDRGYPAVCLIEDNPLVNPDYHRTTDTVGTLNFEFYAQAARASLATLAELAQPVRPGYPTAPPSLAAEPFLYVSLFGAVRNIELTWSAVPGVTGYNVYRSGVSHQGYVRLNTSPLTGLTFTDREVLSEDSFYYVVTAVGPGGLESNNSVEVEVVSELAPSASRAAGRLFSAPGVLN